ncbi:hypothetical protein FRC04_008329 [Tulasnella sp. 424]|nr:hypothetical protein FRC04_008329 [Tulasnella sp. 424]
MAAPPARPHIIPRQASSFLWGSRGASSTSNDWAWHDDVDDDTWDSASDHEDQGKKGSENKIGSRLKVKKNEDAPPSPSTSPNDNAPHSSTSSTTPIPLANGRPSANARGPSSRLLFGQSATGGGPGTDHGGGSTSSGNVSFSFTHVDAPSPSSYPLKESIPPPSPSRASHASHKPSNLAESSSSTDDEMARKAAGWTIISRDLESANRLARDRRLKNESGKGGGDEDGEPVVHLGEEEEEGGKGERDGESEIILGELELDDRVPQMARKRIGFGNEAIKLFAEDIVKDPFFRVQQSSEFRRSAAAALSPPTQSIATFTSTSSVDLSRSRTQPVQDKADRKAEKCEDCLLKENVEMTALRKLAWNGIPDFLRPAAWPLLLGYLPLSSSARAATLNRKREEYRNLVDLTFKRGKEGLDQQIWHQIEIDVPRTRPGSLERILYVWAIRHPASGYVQGINDLVTPFYEVFLSAYIDGDPEEFDPAALPPHMLSAVEADSFWCLSRLLDGIQENYIQHQPGIQKSVKRMRDLVGRIDPTLAAHLESENVEFMQFAFRWMNCLLMREISVKNTIRMWDTYLSTIASMAGRPTRKGAAAAAATAAVATDAIPAAEPPVLKAEETLKPPAVNGRKRSASKSSSPPTTQPVTDASESVDGSQGSEETGGSVKKRARISKKEKEPSAPTRASRRKLTKASSKASMVKAGLTPSTSKTSLKNKEPRVPKVQPPPLNALPGIPPVVRPARQLFVFGTGNFGQFGLGTDEIGEIKRPKAHSWFNEQMEEGKLGSEPGAGLEMVVAGGMHNLAIDEAGRVWSWGVNDGAALGRKTSGVINPETGQPFENEDLETVPQVIQKLVDDKYRAVFVAAGDSVSLAISELGELKVWGSYRSSEGVLGFDGKPGSPKLQYDPTTLSALKKEKFVQAACGVDHVLALNTQGHVYAWGDPRQGAIGRKVLERHVAHGLDPDRLSLRNIVHVASGSWHSFTVDHEGVVCAWGLNSQGQLGLSDESYFDLEADEKTRNFEEHVPTPTQVEALHPSKLGGRKVVQISGGEHHSLFLLDDGSLFACGRHDSAQLGLAEDHPATKALAALKERFPESPNCIPYPVQIYFPPAPTDESPDPSLEAYPEASASTPNGEPKRPIKQISAGTRHNLAVARDGVVYAWGYGDNYELGLGDVDQKDVPGRVRSKDLREMAITVDSAQAGGQHCLLLGRKPSA